MTESPEVLRIQGLTKKFGRILAVDQLDLTILKGQVYGILGPNGSGKTTTLGMILDIVSPTAGTYEWFGGQDPVASRREIGSILETPSFYTYLTAVQNLRVSAHIKRCDPRRIDTVLQEVGLFERRHDPFKTFSLGMKQRLAVASALLADPPVLILDEPTNGLDPEGIAEVRQLIAEIAAKGKTIIMASHLLDEVQKVCSHFCVLRQGKKLHDGSVDEILGTTNQVIIGSSGNQLTEQLSKFQGMLSSKPKNGEEYLVTLRDGFDAADLNKFCFESGVVLKKIDPIKNSLEKEFLKILKEN